MKTAPTLTSMKKRTHSWTSTNVQKREAVKRAVRDEAGASPRSCDRNPGLVRRYFLRYACRRHRLSVVT